MNMRPAGPLSSADSERLRELSDEVGRIASTLARLSSTSINAPVRNRESPEIPEISSETIREIIRARRLREKTFDGLFADPAWDIMLDLLDAELSQLKVQVSSLCVGAAVPATTALRWISNMVEKGYLIRRADPRDGRRIFVELAPETSRRLRRYFAQISSSTVVI